MTCQKEILAQKKLEGGKNKEQKRHQKAMISFVRIQPEKQALRELKMVPADPY